MIYLASPYSHPIPGIRYKRYLAAGEACWLLRNYAVYSPIVHWRTTAMRFGTPEAETFEYWIHHNAEMIRCARAFGVLTLDGWKESKGIAAETKLAHIEGHYITEVSLEDLRDGKHYVFQTKK